MTAEERTRIRQARDEAVRARIADERAARRGDCPLGYGSERGYGVHGCRCDTCRAEASEAKRRRRARYKETPLAPDDPRHGTYNAYRNLVCRCDACREANRARRPRWEKAA